MELATTLLAAAPTPPRAETPSATTPDAPSSFATTMRQLGMDGNGANAPDTAGNTSGNDVPQDGESLPLSEDTAASKTATENPRVTITDDDTPFRVQSRPATPAASMEAKDAPMADTDVKGNADPAAVPLPQELVHAGTRETAPPAATPEVSTTAPTLDQKEEPVANQQSRTANVTVTKKSKPATDIVEMLAVNVDASSMQASAKADVDVPPTPASARTDAPASPAPAPVTPDSAKAAPGRPLAATASRPLVMDAPPLSTDRSAGPATAVQAVTAAPDVATALNATPQAAADTGKAFADTGRILAGTSTSDTFATPGSTAGTHIDTTPPDLNALPQALHNTPSTHAPTPPHAMLATALLANGAPPSGNIAPGYTPAFMGSPAWLDAMDAQINWMQDKGIVDAELKLHPAELGALEISISVQDDKAVVRMVAGTAQARDLLEAALPRLRDMFAASGMQLAHGSVAQGDSQRGQQAPTPQGTPLRDEPATPQAPPRTATMRASSLHSIDHYV